MAVFSYNIFVKPKNLTEFVTGSNWLIGITAEKRDKLITRLEPFAATQNIDSQKIESIIAEFIEWFVEDYEKRENKECPYDENEIVESVGIISLNQSGQYSLYTYGKFRFFHVNDKNHIHKSDYIGRLTEDEILIANPKNASINESILAIENSTDTGNDVQKYQDFSYSFALIRPEQKNQLTVPNANKSYLKVISLSLVLILLAGIIIWFNKSAILTSISASSGDSTSTQLEPPAMLSSNNSADDYFEKAEQSFDFAKSFMEDGKNAKAIQQLDSAAFYYRKVVQSDPSYKEKVQVKIDEIGVRKSVLTGNKEIE